MIFLACMYSTEAESHNIMLSNILDKLGVVFFSCATVSSGHYSEFNQVTIGYCC